MEDAERLKSLKDIATLAYVLQAVGFFVGLSWIAAVVVDYVKKDDAAGTWLESHLRWQIRTFWFGLLWAVIGVPLCFILVGWAVIAADAVWLIYRVVKGWLYLSENRPMPA